LKLYYHPGSTTCRPIMLLAAADKLALDYQLVDLFTGENYQQAFTAINPNQAVPYLEDGDFRLGESSAILKYLADKHDSPAYPKDLQRRARVNERMDWFNTGLYRDLGYGFIYPQVIESHHYSQPEVQSAALAHARGNAQKWLKILDENIIGPQHSFVCGDQPTLADYLGACMITLGEVIHLDYSAYPNVARWLGNMKLLPYWSGVHQGFLQFVAMCEGEQFEGL
jgi:glutathione S-transferase